MEIIELERKGGFLTLELNGVICQFFIISEIKKYADFSSSLVNAGDCVSYTAKLAEVVDTSFDSHGLFVRYSPKKYEYFRDWSGFEHEVGFQELEEPAKNKNKSGN